MSAPGITLICGRYAAACSQALAASDGVALAAHAFHGCWGFEPLTRVFIHARWERDLEPWIRRAAAMILAENPFSGTVQRGNFNGACRGQSVRWSKPERKNGSA
jgi:hypothetical protein